MGLDTPPKTNGWISKNKTLEKVTPALNMAYFVVSMLDFWGVPS